ncbi:MAG: hypothetical protein JXR76_12270 [Deltaproteobacteria bacterium]|nr:hypothetical protein [Deltaproteobacteria bacterium]
MTDHKKIIIVSVVYFVIIRIAFASVALANIHKEKPAIQVRGITEMGLLVPAYHKIQFSNGNTYFDYRKEGGQDNAFLFLRFSAEAVLGGRHTIVALYQPLQLKTNVTLSEDVRIDNVTFPAQTPMDLLYGFDFYRLSYMVDVLKHRKNTELSLGGSLQMRNAVITFTSSDGTMRVANRDVGPVPLLKARFRHQFNNQVWMGAEMDGIWAPIKYINGSNSDVEGAIIDLNVSVGRRLAQSIDGFVNIRYLAGGAEGTSKDTTGTGDGYTKNWLQFLTFSLGFMFSPTDLP